MKYNITRPHKQIHRQSYSELWFRLILFSKGTVSIPIMGKIRSSKYQNQDQMFDSLFYQLQNKVFNL
jgi:hypothetical protein